eukprot:TRINITY_DN12303_c0_g1_i1.p1 TRINITY_DN12303_c0_g1~~TRINITY_DN12303_c0_g1_i1.p1  ORF type:complete len:489 (-),score=128.65 TRINITY_DN12303_c0_g1_i1:147-1613(-)
MRRCTCGAALPHPPTQQLQPLRYRCSHCVPPTPVEVSVSDFDGYLERMAPFRTFFAQNAVELDQYMQQEALREESSTGSTAEDDPDDKFVMEMLSDQLTPAQAKAQAEALQTCFSRTPNVFLRPPQQFDVAQCGVFEIAFGPAEGAEEEMGQLKRCHKAVEKQLLTQISSKFTRFFGLLEDLEDLEDHTQQGVDTVRIMRQGLSSVRGDTVGTARAISDMMAKRRNLQAMLDKLSLVQAIKDSESALRAQLECKDFGGAFKISTQSAAVVRDQLDGVRCLQNTVAKLSGMSEQVHHKMASDFVSIGLAFSSSSPDQRQILGSILLGGGVGPAIKSLRSGAGAQIRAAAQQVLSRAGAAADDLSWLAEIEHDKFVLLLQQFVATQLPLLQSLQELHLFAQATLQQPSSPLMGQLAEVVQAGTDESHKRCARMLGARAKMLHTNLPLSSFHSVYQIVQDFAGHCDKLLGGAQAQGFSLRGALLSLSLIHI